jgi:hypothetical protein
MARPAPILALVTGAVEWRLAKDWTLTAKLDGEFGQGSRTYSATTRLSYAWRGSPPCFSRIVLQSSDRKPRLPANRHAARPTHIGQRRFRLNDAAVNGHSGSHRGGRPRPDEHRGGDERDADYHRNAELPPRHRLDIFAKIRRRIETFGHSRIRPLKVQPMKQKRPPRRRSTVLDQHHRQRGEERHDEENVEGVAIRCVFHGTLRNSGSLSRRYRAAPLNCR